MTTKSHVATVLIVNDNAPIAMVLREGLKWVLNCQVLTALSGQEALRLFKETPIDVLITDSHMTDIDGIALAEQVRHLDSSVAIIMLARGSDADLQEQTARLNIRHVLTKPVGLVQLRKAVLDLIGERVANVEIGCSAG